MKYQNRCRKICRFKCINAIPTAGWKRTFVDVGRQTAYKHFPGKPFAAFRSWAVGRRPWRGRQSLHGRIDQMRAGVVQQSRLIFERLKERRFTCRDRERESKKIKSFTQSVVDRREDFSAVRRSGRHTKGYKLVLERKNHRVRTIHYYIVYTYIV